MKKTTKKLASTDLKQLTTTELKDVSGGRTRQKELLTIE